MILNKNPIDYNGHDLMQRWKCPFHKLKIERVDNSFFVFAIPGIDAHIQSFLH